VHAHRKLQRRLIIMISPETALNKISPKSENDGCDKDYGGEGFPNGGERQKGFGEDGGKEEESSRTTRGRV
jgi:hypothetical protein